MAIDGTVLNKVLHRAISQLLEAQIAFQAIFALKLGC